MAQHLRQGAYNEGFLYDLIRIWVAVNVGVGVVRGTGFVAKLIEIIQYPVMFRGPLFWGGSCPEKSTNTQNNA